jgi:hypothetical protein
MAGGDGGNALILLATLSARYRCHTGIKPKRPTRAYFVAKKMILIEPPLADARSMMEAR